MFRSITPSKFLPLLFLLLAVSPEPARPRSIKVGRVTKISGKLTLNGKRALTGQRIIYGDTLEVPKGSWADLSWAGGDVSRLLGPAKMLHWRQIANDPHLLLEKGRLVSRTSKFSQYTVFTTNAKIRGTSSDFFVSVVSALRTYACRRKGTVLVETRREEDYGLAMRLSARRHIEFKAVEVFTPNIKATPQFLPAKLNFHLEIDYDGL